MNNHFWVTRDLDDNKVYLWTADNKPTKIDYLNEKKEWAQSDDWDHDDGQILSMTVSQFRELTGIGIPPDTRFKVFLMRLEASDEQEG